VVTLDDLVDKFDAARERWLVTARATKSSREHYDIQEPDAFLEETAKVVQYISHQPSIDTLHDAQRAAKMLLIAEHQGLNQAMIWKLSN
jgi:hypothetical protein